MQVAGVAEPDFYPHINTTRQVSYDIEEVVVTPVLPASAFGDGFDGVSGGAPQEFGTQQTVLSRYWAVLC